MPRDDRGSGIVVGRELVDQVAAGEPCRASNKDSRVDWRLVTGDW
jgi:hypothetical protein